MIEEYKEYYVSQTLTKAWSDDDGKVSSYNPSRDKITTGNPTRYFHRKLSRLDDSFPQIINKLDTQFTSLTDNFKSGDYEHIFTNYLGAYSSILFQFVRTPFYRSLHESITDKFKRVSESSFFNDGYNPKKDKASDSITETKFLWNKIGTIYYEEIYIYDLERVYLHAPKGTSFILGPNPVNIINPFMEDDYVEYSKNRYEISGTMLIWPMTPTVAVCFYDPFAYVIKQKNGRVDLAPGDVDVLNKVQIYNSPFNAEFVYKGDMVKTIQKISKKMEHRFFISYNDEDRYTFSTALSFIGIRALLYDNIDMIEEDPRRDFVKKIQDFDDRNLRGLNENEAVAVLKRRYNYANDLIFGEGKWQPIFEQYMKTR